MKHKSLRSAFVCGAAFLLLASACSSDDGTSVASLADDSSQDTATTVATDSSEALLAYAACMRENGIDMADPTFDADGNTTGGLFGANSDIDPRSDEFQAAQDVCGHFLEGVQFGGGPGGNFDPDQIQTALNDFTACLRDEGLDVDDISFGAGGGPGGAGGGPTGPPDGSLPPGGFGGPPNGGSAPGGPGGAGFDPSQAIIDQLGLDDTDPAVTAAVEKCQPLISAAFTPPTGG
jgi:hypothetical protein